MPQQLIYTSAPRGLVAGRSGHCTVARSAAMREALMLQLEKLSYYQHLSLSGGQERPIHSCRVLDIRDSRFHVLSRIQDSGLDFTGRTNFLAHHVVFTPEEIRHFASPPVILRDWSGWLKSWSKEPQLLENEDWTSLALLSGGVLLPASNWKQVTGDEANGYGLLESRVGIAYRVDNLTGEQILALLAESLELLELRDPRRDFRATAWQYTFTTSMQEQDNPADFRWRCLHSDNPASNRFAGPDCRPLSELRAVRGTSEETIMARSGRQPPRIVAQPQDVRATEGTPARLNVLAEGVPSPIYQWFTVDRLGDGQIIPDSNKAELVLTNTPFGVSRYVVRASNSLGDVTSNVVTVSVEQKLRFAQAHPITEMRVSAKPSPPSYVKSSDDIERQRRRIEAERAQNLFQTRRRRKRVFAVLGISICIGLAACAYWMKFTHQNKQVHGNALDLSNTMSPDGAQAAGTNQEIAVGMSPAKTQFKTNDGIGSNAIQEVKTERTITTPAPTEFPLPSDWLRVEIGNVSNPNAEFTSSNYNVSAGSVGFACQGDNVWFVCKTNFANPFQATLLTNQCLLQTSVCGVMARESEKTNAAFLFIGASQSKIHIYCRDWGGGFHSNECVIPKNISTKSVSFRVQVDKDRILPSYSFNSTTSSNGVWYKGDLDLSNAVSKASPLMVGLAISSGSLSNKVIAKFHVVLTE